MTEEHISNSKKGLKLGINAPEINLKDVHGENVNLTTLLSENDFVLIDFFRGAW